MTASKKQKKPPDLVAAGVRWTKVEKAQTWRPGDGEVLQGMYVGTRERIGQHGPYQVHTIRTEAGSFSTSGAVIAALIANSGVIPGQHVRIVFLGYKQSTSSSKQYKDFELYVAHS